MKSPLDIEPPYKLSLHQDQAFSPKYFGHKWDNSFISKAPSFAPNFNLKSSDTPWSKLDISIYPILFSKISYIGSYDGIGCTDLKTNDLQTTWSLRRQIILDIYEDKNGNLWLGTSDGLVEWDLKRDIYTTYTMTHGLPSNAIYGVQGDKQECLWLSTNAGLAQFNIQTHEVTNYYVTDGLQGNEFSKGASYQDAQGNIYFGGINGITYFSPKEIVSPNKRWNVRVTDFYVRNHPVRKGSKSGGKEIMDEAIAHSQKADVKHLARRVFGRGKDESDRIILKEEDFR